MPIAKTRTMHISAGLYISKNPYRCVHLPFKCKHTHSSLSTCTTSRVQSMDVWNYRTLRLYRLYIYIYITHIQTPPLKYSVCVCVFLLYIIAYSIQGGKKTRTGYSMQIPEARFWLQQQLMMDSVTNSLFFSFYFIFYFVFFTYLYPSVMTLGCIYNTYPLASEFNPPPDKTKNRQKAVHIFPSSK